MTTPAWFDASVPVFRRYLGRLRAWLDIAESHQRARGESMAALLQARLASDMLPFEAQAAIAANFALRACFPLAGQAIPAYGEFAADADGLRARIDRVLGLLDELPPALFEDAAGRTLESRAGEAEVVLPAPAFMAQYAMPNFFFHLATAYALLRSRGVPLGKADFDGFHAYPPVRGASA